MGTILYNRREREDLNRILASENIPRTNGFFKLNVSKICKLSNEQKDKLQKVGFLSGDIFEINATNFEPLNDAYSEKGENIIISSNLLTNSGEK